MSTKPAPKKAVPSKKKSSGIKGVVIGVLCAMIAVSVMPTTIIFAIGMVPTLVAVFVDNSRSKNLGATVGFLNFSGVLPALLQLWSGSHTINNAIEIISRPTIILVMLLPAALGWILYGYTPLIIGGILRRRAESRIRSLEKEQDKLVKTWGDQVKTNIKKDEEETESEDKKE